MDFIFFVIVVGAFVSLCIVLNTIFEVKSACAPAAALGIVVLAEYLGGIFHILKPATIFLIVFSYVAFIASVIYKNRTAEKFHISITFSQLFIIVGCALSFLTSYISKKVFITPDDMTMWALSFKVMKTDNVLYSFVDMGQPHFSYPPATQILWYFFTFGQKEIHEWLVLAINNSFVYVGLATAFLKIDGRVKGEYAKKIMLGLLLILCVSSFSSILPFTACLFVEPFMLSMFGALLIMYYFDHTMRKNWIPVFMTCIMLALSKDMGLILVACFCLIIFTDRIVNILPDFAALKSERKNIILMIVCGLSCAFLWIIWNVTGIFSKQGNSIERVEYKQTADAAAGSQNILSDICKAFVNAANTNKIAWGTALSVFVILAIVLFVVYRYVIARKNPRVSRGIVVSMCVGYLAQIAFLILMYMLIFSKEEALRLAEMQRYLSPFLGGYFIFAVASVGSIWMESRHIKNSIVKCSSVEGMIVFAVLIISCLNLKYTPFYFEYKKETEYDANRAIVSSGSDEIKSYLTRDDIIYVIAQGDCRNGSTSTISVASIYEYYPYYIIPNVDVSFALPTEGWENLKYGATRYQSEYYTTYVTVNEWINYLREKDVTKILVVPTAKSMESEFNDMFEDCLEGITEADSPRLYAVYDFEEPFERLY